MNVEFNNHASQARKRGKTDPNNYCGIAVLPVIYELFEKVILLSMPPFLNQHGTYFPDSLQDTYQKNLPHSCKEYLCIYV